MDLLESQTLKFQKLQLTSKQALVFRICSSAVLICFIRNRQTNKIANEYSIPEASNPR